MSHALYDLNFLCEHRPLSQPKQTHKTGKDQIMNPEQALDEIAAAIRHRCISTTQRWHIIYYWERFCCVPSYEHVPPEIILGELTEEMVRKGLSIIYWNQIKTNITKLHKELSP